MTKEQEKQLNDFFVHIFNKINICENQALGRIGAKNLSVKEIHVLEAASELSRQGRNTMSAVAESLAIQTSSLTTAVNTLVRKGYLTRRAGTDDRRQVYITLTPKGEAANQAHSRFHTQMIRGATARLSDGEVEVLVQALAQLGSFFTDMLAPDGEGQDNPEARQNRTRSNLIT